MKQTRREINLIVVHCSATREDRSYTPEQMERDHKARGFNSAGYNFYIRRSGEIISLRPLDQIPAHAKGYNRNSIGICYEGGLDSNGVARDTRTNAQRLALESLLKQLIAAYPDSKIVGHRDLSPDLNGNGIIEPNEWTKMCPCFDASVEYKHLSNE